ncbi:DUF3037 domain-containing protein [Ancylobacter sp. Lp-2]|uniref:DUF3037 domain-containing protein n=1 Tax=Ancylobacter sp. Lp-2 TaxID=2881339 RepID=UPI001E431F6A|nr:DUF3037 domain-containing protein [Ancylobacter sp. Lp-2]MCB4771061.1 DUF3037 domain-containing protein [Ancylobacter sp. Lp-2]
MIDKVAYSYTLLRYVHDVLTGEFVNVGVVLFVPATGQLCFKMRTTIGRLKGAFPDIDRVAFVSSMKAVRRGLDHMASREKDAGLFRTKGDAAAVARQALPPDDSSLQWSPCGTGLTGSPEETLERLFQRFVTRYDAHTRHRKTDEDVWRPVRQQLEERNIAQCLQEKSIQGGLDEIVFKHAWKNGQWHVYEPLSFDLADADGIKGKAREWLGHLSAVVAGGKAEHFKPHFIVGAPTNPTLAPAYRTAIAILEKAPNNPEIYEENQLDKLVAQIEDEMRDHEREVSRPTVRH